MSELSSLSVLTLVLVVAVALLVTANTSAQTAETLSTATGWKEHHIKQGDGEGGWIVKSAECQFVHHREGGGCMGFGLAQMDNGEVVLLGTWDQKTAIAFSSDRGDSWSEFEAIPGINGRPMMLAYLGGGNLTFVTDKRYFSSDYGRTWSESIPMQPASNGGPWYLEGNPLVEQDAQGLVTRIAEIGWNHGENYPITPTNGFFRWSYDGGRTWTDEVQPKVWRWQETYDGKTYTRSISEGSLVRAQNGWVVAALRTDMPARYLHTRSDHMEGTGVSISKDEGRTWSPIKVLYDAGRMHAHLLRMPNGDLVMTLTVRVDVREGKVASYRRGCEAIVSHDNGLTWDLERKYVLDDWTIFNPDPDDWEIGACGHLYSVLLDDGSILTAHNNYVTKGISLIRWRP